MYPQLSFIFLVSHYSIKYHSYMCRILYLDRFSKEVSKLIDRVKSGKFDQTAKLGQRPCLFHLLIIGK